MRFDILGIGTIAVDDFLFVAAYPNADGKAEIRRTARSLGGQVTTALAAAARLGARCAYAAALGADELSSAGLRALGEAGIDTQFVVETPGASPIHSVIVVDETAKSRAIFFDRSCLKPLPPEAVTSGMVASARVLVLDQLGPETMIAAARLARDLGVPTVFDFEWPQAERTPELVALAEHLILPYDFAAAYTGLNDARAMVESLHSRRVCTAVTCGAEGGFYACAGSGGEAVRWRVVPVETVETTGCGDVFHGAYAAALARGEGVGRGIAMAAAAAALYASRPAGWRHLATLDEVLKILIATGEIHEF